MSEIKEFNRDNFLRFIGNVRQEILNMQSGEGKWRPGALHFEKDKASPVMHRLEMLENNPTKKNLDEFLLIAKQDFGTATARAFSDWSHSIFPPTAKEKAQVPTKAFDVSIKDGFYDMFKACRIPLEPKQLILLEKAALRLAKVFEMKIATTVGFQLGNLVKKMKEDEVKPIKLTPVDPTVSGVTSTTPSPSVTAKEEDKDQS
jgi:hypothetical protein